MGERAVERPGPEGSAPVGARQSSLRELNLATVLRWVYASGEPVSRADVAAGTGMTRSTVSRLVDELVEHGLVAELPPVIGGQRGRPGVPLVPAAGSLVGLGLEVNVGHMAARLVDLSGGVLAEEFVAGEFARCAPREGLALVADLGRRALQHRPDEAGLVGVQLALPGLVDAASGLLLRSPNLGWDNLAPRDALLAAGLVEAEARFSIGNEADYAALTVAQSAPGRPSGRDDFLYVSGEVGVGSAVVTRGNVATGRHGWAGEIGHVCVRPDGPRCGCGALGCLEVFAGQRAMLVAAGVPDADALAGALGSGDPRAAAVVAEAGTALGIALSSALNLLDLSLVVLGGHLGQLAEHLMPRVLAELTSRVLAGPFDPPRVEAVALDRAPAALGASYASLNAVIRDPAAWLEA